ncbi:hypothetical protein JRQ81_011069 [Phrynocephalus forsythii]|uniref:Apolipoprotein C-III n=1 Tax=Phrynocephalus forsythii TaxID=171643 RepID=A0A9Q1AQZ4_9SAUR|nr:hypothetical protein JRQ81_011069 [Phrynocephalus forsythii]
MASCSSSGTGPAEKHAMRVPLLLVLLALFVTLAWAQDPVEESLLAKMQHYAQQASERAQEHVATFQQSEVAQKAREWMESSLARSKEYLTELRDRFSTLWETSS